MSEPTPPTSPAMNSEPALPRDADAVRPVAVGTALWALAFVVLLTQRSWLDQRDAAWWLWVPVVGIALGLIGLLITTRRRPRRKAGDLRED